eukprot:scaffold15586_cov100-Isochrysis_galbana.AAC.10
MRRAARRPASRRAHLCASRGAWPAAPACARAAAPPSAAGRRATARAGEGGLARRRGRRAARAECVRRGWTGGPRPRRGGVPGLGGGSEAAATTRPQWPRWAVGWAGGSGPAQTSGGRYGVSRHACGALLGVKRLGVPACRSSPRGRGRGRRPARSARRGLPAGGHALHLHRAGDRESPRPRRHERRAQPAQHSAEPVEQVRPLVAQVVPCDGGPVATGGHLARLAELGRVGQRQRLEQQLEHRHELVFQSGQRVGGQATVVVGRRSAGGSRRATIHRGKLVGQCGAVACGARGGVLWSHGAKGDADGSADVGDEVRLAAQRGGKQHPHLSADTAEERARCGLPKNLRRKGAAGSASIQMKAPPNKTHSSSSRPAEHCGAWLGSGDRRCLGLVNVRAFGGWVEAGADLGSCACRVTCRERGFTRLPPPCKGPAIGASEDPTIRFVLTRRGSIAGHWRRGAPYLWRLGRQRNHGVDLEQPLPQGPAERRRHPEHGEPTLDGDRHRLHLFARFSRRQPRQQLRLVVAVRLEQHGLNQRICGGDA